jgi:hypothetical protein
LLRKQHHRAARIHDVMIGRIDLQLFARFENVLTARQACVD